MQEEEPEEFKEFYKEGKRLEALAKSGKPEEIS